MKKPLANMTATELERAARKFDVEAEPRFGKAPADEKRRHDALLKKIKRDRGRPRVGGGSRRVQITMERTLLSHADRFAREHGLSRSELISQCLMPVVLKKSA